MGRKHGQYGSLTYESWRAMKERCTNPRHRSWSKYGGKGIRIFPAWVVSFDAFLRDVGQRPSKRHTLDRFPDRHGNYIPGNVRWATREEQRRNADGLGLITHGGRSMCLSDWAATTGIPYRTLAARFARGWPVKLALTPGPQVFSGRRDDRGEKNPVAKLTAEAVLDARRRHESGESFTSIAKSYGVNRQTMTNAINGKTWRHVERKPGPEVFGG